MRQVLSIAAVLAVVAFAGQAFAADAKAICPVAGKPAKDSVTADYKGTTVALCCGNCKKAFEANFGRPPPLLHARLLISLVLELSRSLFPYFSLLLLFYEWEHL